MPTRSAAWSTSGAIWFMCTLLAFCCLAKEQLRRQSCDEAETEHVLSGVMAGSIDPIKRAFVELLRPQPLIDALLMEAMAAVQDSDTLAGLRRRLVGAATPS